MINKTSLSKPSNTAFITALYRAVAQKEFPGLRWGPDVMADYFLPFHIRFLIQYEKIRAKGRAKERKQTPGVYEYVLARTLFFDDLFLWALKEPIPQIVMLGAGYDTRVFRFKDFNQHTQIIELDAVATQKRKLKCLAKRKINIPENTRFSSIDFNRESLETALSAVGYRSDAPTLFIWEGVSMYLESRAVEDTLAFVAQRSHPDSLVAFDYALSIPDQAMQDAYGVKTLLQYFAKNRSDEPFKFFLEENQIGPFLDRQNLKLVRHLDCEGIETSFLKKDDGSFIGRSNGMFCLAVASRRANIGF